MNNKNLILTILTIVLSSLSVTQAEYTAKLILQSDAGNGYNGNLPAGSIVFDGESGSGNNGGNNGSGEGGQDPEEIVCGYSMSGNGYGGYGYHYVESPISGGSGTVWFQDNYVGSSSTITRGNLIYSSEFTNYYEVCAPRKMLDAYNLQDEKESGMQDLLLSSNGSSFTKNLTVNASLTNSNYVNIYYANSPNSTSDIGFSDSSYRWISGGYSDWCVSTSTPYNLKPGQVKLVNQAFNFSGCNITTPGVYEYTGTTSGGEVFTIRINVSND